MVRPFRYIASIISAMFALWVSGIIIWTLTDKLTVFTSETWRRKSIETSAQLIPHFSVEDQHGKQFKVTDDCGKVMVVDFIYTSCPTICKGLGATTSQLSRAFERSGLDVSVYSISIDPEKDTPDRMLQFKRSMEPTQTKWRVVRTLSNQDLVNVMKFFGVVAIRDQFGGYEHNAALHIVDKSCKLVRVLDDNDVEGAKKLVSKLAANEN